MRRDGALRHALLAVPPAPLQWEGGMERESRGSAIALRLPGCAPARSGVHVRERLRIETPSRRLFDVVRPREVRGDGRCAKKARCSRHRAFFARKDFWGETVRRKFGLTRRIELTCSCRIRDRAKRVWEAPSVHTACVTSCTPHPPIRLRTGHTRDTPGRTRVSRLSPRRSKPSAPYVCNERMNGR